MTRQSKHSVMVASRGSKRCSRNKGIYPSREKKEKYTSAATVEETSRPWILLRYLASVYTQRSMHRDTNSCVRLVLGAKPICSGLSKD